MSTISLRVKQLVQYAQQATGHAAILYAGYLVASPVTLTFRESRAVEANKKRLEPTREERVRVCVCFGFFCVLRGVRPCALPSRNRDAVEAGAERVAHQRRLCLRRARGFGAPLFFPNFIGLTSLLLSPHKRQIQGGSQRDTGRKK